MRKAIAVVQAALWGDIGSALWGLSGRGVDAMNIELLVPRVLEHAGEVAPKECCGLAVISKGKLRYWPCRNVSEFNNQFVIDPLDQIAAEQAGEVVGVCHSHVFVSPEPSEADRVMCERTGMPWLIVNHPTGSFRVIEPSGYVAPIVGRQYSHGVLDCYQLIVDHYATLGIALPHFHREDGWWNRGQNLYLENFEKAGFKQVGAAGNISEIRQNDVLLIQVQSHVPNHAAIYIGENQILHHVYGRLSSRDVYGGYWQSATTHVLRNTNLK